MAACGPPGRVYSNGSTSEGWISVRAAMSDQLSNRTWKPAAHDSDLVTWEYKSLILDGKKMEDPKTMEPLNLLGDGQRYASQRGCQSGPIHLQATPAPLTPHHCTVARNAHPIIARHDGHALPHCVRRVPHPRVSFISRKRAFPRYPTRFSPPPRGRVCSRARRPRNRPSSCRKYSSPAVRTASSHTRTIRMGSDQ